MMTEDVKFYLTNSFKLSQSLRDKRAFATLYSGHVGIINQGATCYLNSLIQCLFYDLLFRTLVLESKSESAFLIAFKRIFCHLQLSESSAISTDDLLTAFGWSRGQISEQHDIHELFSLLLGRLSDNSVDIGDLLSGLFRGTVADVLQCPSCGYKRECETEFLSVSLEIKRGSSLGIVTPTDSLDSEEFELTDLLDFHMETEILDSDNRWVCSGCTEKVQALKSHEYKLLPQNLMIHLKRLRYDTVTKRREKVTTPVDFPYILDASVLRNPKCLRGDEVDNSESSNGDMYRLHSVLLHTGTAKGGHYKAYVRNAPSGRWLECDDSSVCELSHREEESLFFSRTDSIPEGNSTEESRKDGSGEGARKYVSLRDHVLRENAYMLLYVRDGQGQQRDSNIGNNLKYSDIENVFSYGEAERTEVLTSRCINAVPIDLAAEIRKENFELRELRSLYQMQKKITPLKIMYSKSQVEILNKSNSNSHDHSESSMRNTGCNTSDLGSLNILVLCSDTLEMVLCRACEELSLCTPDNLSMDVLHDPEKPSTTSLSNSIFIDQKKILFRLRDFSEIGGRKGTTYGTRTHETLTTLGIHLPHTIATSAPVVMLLEIRCENDPLFSEVNDDAMLLRMLTWSTPLKEAIEVSDKLQERLVGLYPIGSDSNSSTDMLDAASLAMQSAMCEVLVPGELTATLGALRESVASALCCSVQDIILVYLDHNGVMIMDSDQDHRSLNKAYGIRPGDCVFVEVRRVPSSPAGVDFDISESVTTSEAFSVIRNHLDSIRVLFNDPRNSSQSKSEDDVIPSDAPDDSLSTKELFIMISSHKMLKDLKQAIANKIDALLDINSFRMLHSECPAAAHYKDESKSLNDLGFRDNIYVHLKMGRGCELGEHALLFELEECTPSCVTAQNTSISDVDISAACTVSSRTALPRKRSRSVVTIELIVQELITVLQLKEQLLNSWDLFLPIPIPIATGDGKEEGKGDGVTSFSKPKNLHHIRLRDAKVAGCGGSGPLLRNERMLSRCLLGMCDGRKLTVEVLQEEEIIGPLDWILRLRCITYSTHSPSSATTAHCESSFEDCQMKRHNDVSAISKTKGEYAVKKVHRAVDLPLSRATTVRQLYQAILRVFPHLRDGEQFQHIIADSTYATDSESKDIFDGEKEKENISKDDFPERHLLSVAKGFSSGPPLTIKSSLKAIWDAPALTSSPDIMIDHPSIGFRDGLLLLVRGADDWKRGVAQDESLQQVSASFSKAGNLSGRMSMAPAMPWKSMKNEVHTSPDNHKIEKGLSLGDGS